MSDSKVKLIAMDLDGTLTQHKSKLESFNKDILDKLSKKYKLVIVGAGSCKRIYDQLDAYPIDIIGNYGMQFASCVGNDFKLLEDNMVEVDKQNVTTKINELRAELNFTDFIGETVEFHQSGSVTFPILGTKAKLEDKLKYDPDRLKRRKIYDIVKDKFNEYIVFIGGTSSFDISPKPYNKLFALQKYAKSMNISDDEIVYIGDDYGLGGNDESIYNSNIRFLTIDNYKDFPKIVNEFLN